MFELETIKERCSATSVKFYPQLESTNDSAISMVRDGCSLPLLVLCENQTAGRGQRGNSWRSSAGSLTLSWCFRPGGSSGNDVRLQMSSIVGCVVAGAIERLCPNVKLLLKWPNDILAASPNETLGKVAGILVESVLVGGQTPSFVVGIGVNVNNSIGLIDQIERRTSLPPASLSQLAGESVDMTKLAVEIVQGLERAFVGEVANEDWRREFESRLAFRGQMVSVLNISGEVEFEGLVDSVADDGALICRDSGRLQKIYSGTIRPI